MAFIKRDDGTEKSCNTTKTTCSFFCACGYTYLVTVFPYNQAGSSPYANVQNYTTSNHHKAAHTIAPPPIVVNVFVIKSKNRSGGFVFISAH